jgi:hypothetical protein
LAARNRSRSHGTSIQLTCARSIWPCPGARHAGQSISTSWPGNARRSITCSTKGYAPLPVAWTLARSRVYFVLPVMGGFSGGGLASLPDELAETLRTPKIQSKISKLSASGLEERHLFLIVRPSAFSWPVFEGLAFDGPLPTGAPLLPDGLSQVWLLTGLQMGGVTRGISGRGWYRDRLPKALDELAI